MTYSFDLKSQEGIFEIGIDTKANYGYFEHITLGDEYGGELWFDDNKNLIDYDGIFSLPKEVITELRKHGYYISKEFI